MFFCDPGFHAVFVRQSSDRKGIILKKSKILKNTLKRMFTLGLHRTLCLCVCVCVCVWIIFASCVWLYI